MPGQFIYYRVMQANDTYLQNNLNMNFIIEKKEEFLSNNG